MLILLRNLNNTGNEDEDIIIDVTESMSTLNQKGNEADDRKGKEEESINAYISKVDMEHV